MGGKKKAPDQFGQTELEDNMFGPVNYLAILVAAIAHFIVGFIWYGLLFSKKWLELLNPDEAKMEAMKKGTVISFIGNFVGAFILAYATARIINTINPADIVTAILWMVLLWAGYVLIVGLNDSFFEKKPWGLFFINTLYMLVSMVIVGLILFYWK
jgi:hypothetical protein